MKDIEKSEKHPNATKDDAGQLRVGAAIGTGAETLDRAKSLYDSESIYLLSIVRMVILKV